MGGGERARREWPAATGLFLLLLVLAVVHPLVLLGVPLAFLALLRRPVHPSSLVTAGAILWLVFSTGDGSGMGLLERGWAVLSGGAFAVFSRWGASRSFLARALPAVGVAAAMAALVLTIWPHGWLVAEWVLTERIGVGASLGIETLEAVSPSAVAGSGFATAGERAAEAQAAAAPALLALSTLAALGVAWWIDQRLLAGEEGALGPLEEFRFPDGLVGLFVAGLGMVTLGVVAGGGSGHLAVRLGANVLLFTGALYGLRGLGVFVALTGGLSWPGYLALALALVVAAPFVLLGALGLGLVDTWLELRGRPAPAGGRPHDEHVR